jgi:hypothetical protein
MYDVVFIKTTFLIAIASSVRQKLAQSRDTAE